MAKLNYSTTISIDTRRSVIHYYSMLGNDVTSIEHRVKSYSGMLLDDAFFARFKELTAEFVAETPSESVRKVSLVLPDNAVALDTINVPTMQSKNSTKNALNLALGEIYRNLGDLKIHTHQAAQNRQYTTFSTTAIQKKLLTSLYSACSENKLLVDTATYAASATTAAVAALNPKLKNATYLFLDIKSTYSRFVFVINGRAAGFYTLPFGLEFLARPKYVQEDMLFDHTMSELTVLNARERAKAKKLTVLAEEEPEAQNAEEDIVLDEDMIFEDADEDDKADEEEQEEVEDGNVVAEPFAMSAGQRIDAPKVMAKKTPRRLPKFMQRPIPETDEGVMCENFRVFVKWALSLLATNEKITQLGMPEFVCVNVPDAISFVLDSANEELEENGIEFRKLDEGKFSRKVLYNLELFGGLFPKSVHPATKF